MKARIGNRCIEIPAGRVRGGVRSMPKNGQAGANLAPSPYRSKLEAAFACELTLRKRLGLIQEWWYEPVRFRLPGKRNLYTPDFLVLDQRGLTFLEVKGWSKSYDRSLVKLKTAAGLNRWARFLLVKRIGARWDETELV